MFRGPIGEKYTDAIIVINGFRDKTLNRITFLFSHEMNAAAGKIDVPINLHIEE